MIASAWTWQKSGMMPSCHTAIPSLSSCLLDCHTTLHSLTRGDPVLHVSRWGCCWASGNASSFPLSWGPRQQGCTSWTPRGTWLEPGPPTVRAERLTWNPPGQAVCRLRCVWGRASPIWGVGPWGQRDVTGCVHRVPVLVTAPAGQPVGGKRSQWLSENPQGLAPLSRGG